MSKLQSNLKNFFSSPGFWITMISLAAAIYVANQVEPTWVVQKTVYQTEVDEDGKRYYLSRGKVQYLPQTTALEDSVLYQDGFAKTPAVKSQWVHQQIEVDGELVTQYALLEAKYHLGWWSLLPALVAVSLCLISREPLTALLGGIVVGAFMLSEFDVTDEVLIPSMATTASASVLLLYLWLLGGLLGIWSKTGAAQAFADYMADHFIRGPKSAKLVAWFLGVLFFQGGSVSTVLVGTTVKPFADKEKISHEEMSYIVDSTASPIAILIAFNAWPAYIQALIFVPGVAFLATEADRIAFFFSATPLSFYALFAVIGTFLLSIDYTKFAGNGMRKALVRARTTGELDAPNAAPLSAKELHQNTVPENYRPHVLEFVLPLLLIIGIAIGTFVHSGVPKVNWAFGIALLFCAFVALAKGMNLSQVIDGFGTGLKGVVVASVILLLAIAVGTVSKQVGAGLFLVDLLGQSMPYWILPVCLQLLTMVIAFSTGTSWGTFAIAFPLAMPLAWAIGSTQGLANPELYMMICFATVLNGSVYGDQCSPISDTTVISAMTTGCDLVDHVKTQIVPASLAATLAAICWTTLTLVLV